MLNEISATGNSSSMLSGTGRSKASKDGSFAGLCPFTDDPEQRQKDFLSILSQFGVATVQVMPEESKSANPNLSEGRLPDGAKAEDAFSEKPEGKQGKDGCTAKCLPSGYPETHGLVMGFLSVPSPPQADLSTAPAYDTPCAESEETIDPGLAAGKLLPEKIMNKGELGEHNFQTGSLSMVPVPADLDRDSAVPDNGPATETEQMSEVSSAPEPVPADSGQALTSGVKGLRQFQGRPQPSAEAAPELATVPKADPPRLGRDRVAALEATETEQRPEASSTPEPVPTDSGQALTSGVKGLRQFQGRPLPATEAAPELATVPKADPPRLGRVRVAALEATETEQRPEASSTPEPVPTDSGQALTSGVKGLRQFQGRPQPSAEAAPELATVPKADPPRLGRVRVAALEATETETEQRPGASSTPEPVPVDSGQDLTSGIKGLRQFQGRPQPSAEAAPELGTVPKADPPRLGRVRVAALEATATETETEQRPEASSTPEPVPTDSGQALTSGVKGLRQFQGRLQPEAEAASASDAAGTARVQSVQLDRMQTLQRQRQSDPISTPDTGNLNPLAEKNNSGVQGGQTQRLFADSMSMEATAREKVQTGRKDDPDIRPQAVKVKSASFHPANDSGDSNEISAPSVGASNTHDNETPNMFMAANQSGKMAGDEKDALFQPPEPASEELAVNFSSEGRMEKTSSVKPTPNESGSEVQSFHTDVLKQIVEKTSINLKSGQSEIRIDLKPETLGHLRLHVSTDNQQVTVKILAENPLVKEMIENQVPLIKNELQQQGIHVNTVSVDTLMSDGSNLAYTQQESSAFKQARQESAFGGGMDHFCESASKEPDSSDPVSNRGGTLVNYFA